MINKKQYSRSPSKLIILFLLITSFIIIIGLRYYIIQKEEIKSSEYKELSIISGLKADQISNWRRERLGDGYVIMNKIFLKKEIKKLFAVPD